MDNICQSVLMGLDGCVRLCTVGIEIKESAFLALALLTLLSRHGISILDLVQSSCRLVTRANRVSPLHFVFLYLLLQHHSKILHVSTQDLRHKATAIR